MMGDVGITIHGNETVSKASSQASGALNRLKDSAGKTAESIGVSWQDAALAVGAVYLAFNKVKDLMMSLFSAYDEGQQAETKLAAALKATGNVAQFTTNQLKGMAAQMQNLTTFGDEALMEAQAIMLTFKSIGHDVFPRAMDAAADLSAMFGQDLTTATIMLSKALNEPVAGINAMHRVGVSFSAEATLMVKHLEEIGDIAAAQAVILKEVEGQVKGTAAAFALMGSGPVRQLENKFGDFKEAMGRALFEGLKPLFAELSEFIDYLSANVDVLKDIGGVIANLGKVIIGIIEFVIRWREAVIAFVVVAQGVPAVISIITAAMSALGLSASAALGPIGLIVAALGVLVGTIISAANRAAEAKRELEEFAKATEKDFRLIEEAQKGSLKSLSEYYEAQSLVEKKVADIRKALIEQGEEHKALYERMLNRQQAVLDSINANIEAEKERLLLVGALEGTLESYGEYAKAIDLQNEKITEWEAKLASATEAEKKEIGEYLAGSYKILAALKARGQQAYLETEEYKKKIAERTKLEEEYADKFFALTASRMEILKREEDEAVKKAREVGAELTNIRKYYAAERLKIIEEETKAEIEALQRFIAERENKERSAYAFLTDWAGKGTESRLAILEKEKNTVLATADQMYEALAGIYGKGIVEDIAAGNDTIAGSDADIKAIGEFVALYKAAIAEIGKDYAARIGQAQEEINKLQQLGGEHGVALYNEMLAISNALLDPVEKQRQELEAQVALLGELRDMLPSDLSRMSEFQKEIAENIPALLEKIQERLKELANQPFVEIAKEVAGIADRFKDPAVKAKEAIEKDIAVVEKYLTALKEKSKTYRTEQEYIDEWGAEVQATGELLDKLDAELKEAKQKIKKSQNIASFWDLFTASIFSFYSDFLDSAYEQYSRITGKDKDDLSPEEQQTAVSFSLAAEAGTFLTGVIMDLANWFLQLLTSTEAFQEFVSDFNEALVSIVEFAVTPLIEALMPLATMALQLVGIVANFVAPVFQMLGELIKMLEPLWVALGNLLLSFLKVVIQLAPILFFLGQLIGENLTPVINLLSSVLSGLGEIIVALQPVFDVLGYVTDAVGRVFRSLWVIADFLLSPFKALGEMLFYIITFQWDKIGNIQVMTPQQLMQELSGIWSQSWGMQQYQDFVPDFGEIGQLEIRTPEELDELTPTIYGGNVSVQRAPDIYIYQYFNAPIIGPWGPVEVGEYMVGAISDYVGMGGKITWEAA